MSEQQTPEEDKKHQQHHARIHGPFGLRMRSYFLAGVLVTAPLGLTLWLIWRFVSFVDGTVMPLIPARWNPETYLERAIDLPFDLPGMGLVVALVGLTLIGFVAAGYMGRMVMRASERLVNSIPVVRSIYGSIKQILETVLQQETSAFRRVVLVEYPRRGVWAVGFVTGETEGEVQRLTKATTVNVFIPATPNPTTGFLLFIPNEEVYDLDLSVEAGIKLVVSGGIVVPPDDEEKKRARLNGDALKPKILESEEEKRRKASFFGRLRTYFLTGILVTVPISLTVWLALELLAFVDSRVVPLIPEQWNPDTYLPFSIPGLGLVVLVIFLILVGMVAAGVLGRAMTGAADRVVGRLPIARSIYSATKQIIETIIAQQSSAFRDVILFEYPRKESWALGFVTGRAEGQIQDHTQADVVNVFLPTTPNPTSGFLLFIPRQEAVKLSMTVEEGLKMVVSGGIITPKERKGATPPLEEERKSA
jgi:uncharacterized membrane protein